MNTLGKGALSLQRQRKQSSSPPAGHPVGFKPILMSLAAEDSRKGKKSIHPPLFNCLQFVFSTHTHFINPNVPRPQTSFVRAGVQKLYIFLGLAYVLKGLHTFQRTLDQPRSSDNDHKRICRISSGRGPWAVTSALKALTPLPRLWLRSPASGFSASKTTQARIVEPGWQARAHAVSPSPAPRGG